MCVQAEMSQTLQAVLTSLQTWDMLDLLCPRFSQAICMWDCHLDHDPVLGRSGSNGI